MRGEEGERVVVENIEEALLTLRCVCVGINRTAWHYIILERKTGAGQEGANLMMREDELNET